MAVVLDKFIEEGEEPIRAADRVARRLEALKLPLPTKHRDSDSSAAQRLLNYRKKLRSSPARLKEVRKAYDEAKSNFANVTAADTLKRILEILAPLASKKA